MTFSQPLALWLLALLPLVLLAHSVGVRRRDVAIPTARFFTSVDPSGGEPRPQWRQLQRSWLLWLQLLALAAMALALAGPTFTSARDGYASEVLVLDTSASMRSREPGNRRDETRLDSAKAAISDAIDALQPGQRGTLLTTSPALLTAWTDDRAALKAALASAVAGDSAGDVTGALRLASSLTELTGEQDAKARLRVRVYTDAPLPDATYSGALHVERHGIGVPSANAAVTALTLRRAPGDGGRYELFVRVANYDQATRALRLDIARDDTSLFDQNLELTAGGERRLILPFEHTRGGVLRARVRYVDGTSDSLAADDVARLVLPPPRTRKVSLVTPGNLFVSEALRASADTELSVRLAGAQDGTADITVLDGNAPATLAPGRYLLIRTLPENAPVRPTGEVSLPAVVDWRRDHPVTRYLQLDGVLVRSALAIEERRPEQGGTVLVDSTQTPLVYAWDDGKVRAVYVGFDLHDSDLRVRAAFPLLVHAALEWLDPLHLDDLTLAVPSGTQDMPLAGLFERNGTLHAANLLDRDESDLRQATPNTARAPGDASAQPASSGFDRPFPLWPALALLGAAALVIEALLYRRRRAHQPLALVPRAGAVIALLLVPWQPTFSSTSSRVQTAIALDQSASVTSSAASSSPANVRAEAEGAKAAANRLHAVLPFGGEANGGGTTDIALGLRQAAAALPGSGERRVVLLSDGNALHGDAARAAREAAALGIDVHTVAIGGPVASEVRLEGLVAPAIARTGEPIDLRVTAHSESAGSALLTVSRNGEPIATRDVELAAGRSTFVARSSVEDPGYAVFEARINRDGDRVVHNNVALAVTDVQPAPRVLLLDGAPGQAAPMVSLLAAQGIATDLAGPPQMRGALDALARYDAVILSDFSSLDMETADMQVLHDYVHDAGGGLLMLGGEQSFGLGGYYQTPIEQALPVSMAVRQKLDVPSTSLVLVIDRSGSMNRFDGEFNRLALAKEAAQRAVELLSERSEIGVLAFDMKSSWVVPIRSNGDKGKVLSAISTLQAGGGGTQLMWGLQKAYRAIDKRESMIRHVIVLSDGEVYSSKFPELLGRMVDKNITVSAVTIGSRTGQPQMREISELGRGRFYYSSNASKLPRIFTMETQLAARTALVEETFTPAVRLASHEILRDVGVAGMPALDGYVATTAKRSAQTLLASHHDDPVLSVWRYGLGRAAVFTSELKTRWGSRLLDWPQTGQLVAQLVRWTLRSARDTTIAADARLASSSGELQINVVSADGRIVNLLDGQAEVAGPGGQRAGVALEQTGPGRYTGRFAADGAGAWLLRARLSGATETGATERLAAAQVTRPYPAEHRAAPVNYAHLDAIAHAGGGHRHASLTAALAVPPRGLAQQRPAWPWLLGLAIVLLALDLASRVVLERRAAA